MKSLKMVKFEKGEMMKKRLYVKNTWYDWLINYTPKCVKDGRWYYRKKFEHFLNKLKQRLLWTSACWEGIKKTKNFKKAIREGYIIKDIRSFFKLRKENDVIKDTIIRDIRNLFEKEGDYYKPVRVGNFYSNNYIECESNGDKN